MARIRPLAVLGKYGSVKLWFASMGTWGKPRHNFVYLRADVRRPYRLIVIPRICSCRLFPWCMPRRGIVGRRYRLRWPRIHKVGLTPHGGKSNFDEGCPLGVEELILSGLLFSVADTSELRHRELAFSLPLYYHGLPFHGAKLQRPTRGPPARIALLTQPSPYKQTPIPCSPELTSALSP
jgi:hypothetical protein